MEEHELHEFNQEEFEEEEEVVPVVSESDEEIIPKDNLLKGEYDRNQGMVGEGVAEVVRGFMKYRERRTYHLFVSDKTDYFQSMWHFLQKKLYHQSIHVENELLEALAIRQSNIHYEIIDSELEVAHHKAPPPLDQEEQLKSRKVSMLRDQEQEIHRKLNDINSDINEMKNHRTGESRLQPFEISEVKKKEYQEFLRKQKKEKEERTKVIEEHRKKEEVQRKKKEEVDKEEYDEVLKKKKEELLKKIREKEEVRLKSQSERDERSKQYKVISKSLAQHPPLFKKIEQSYYSRYSKEETERKQKMTSERHSMFQIDIRAIEDHERRYDELKSERNVQRRERMDELEKIMDLQQEEVANKFKSNYEVGKKTDFIDSKEADRRMGQEKKEKVKRYIEETVKERYLPKIDEEKRKDFLKMIEDLGKKKVKKVVRQDGTVEYEEVRPSDPRMVGLEYLEQTKEMANKMRGKRKNSDQINDVAVERPKVVDYLGEMRKKGTAMSHRDRYSFVNRKGVSYDQKVRKVEMESLKLQELVRQKEMKLKYGKFGTSEQILQHKEDIDQHYMDIIDMKLKLINAKEE